MVQWLALQILVLSITVRVGIPQQVLTDKLAYSIMAITSDSGPDDGGSIPSMPTTSAISTTVSMPDFQSGYVCSI